MSDNIAVDHPDVEFLRPCNLCPHMKRITLPAIRRALETMTTAVEIDPEVAGRARGSIARMVASDERFVRSSAPSSLWGPGWPA